MDPTLIKHFCLTLIVWMILQSIYRPQNTLPLTFHSSENQSRVHLVSLGYPLKPPKHPCLPSTLFASVGLILLQRTFLSLPLTKGKDKNGKVAGGVLMCISCHITYRGASPYESSDLELLCVKIAPRKSNCPLFLIGVYRPESSTDMDQQLENNLYQLYNTDKEIILLGDININALNDDHVYHRLRRYTSSLVD